MFNFIKSKKQNKAYQEGSNLGQKIVIGIDSYFEEELPLLVDGVINSLKDSFRELRASSDQEKLFMIKSYYNIFIEDFMPIFKKRLVEEFYKKYPNFIGVSELLEVSNEVESYLNLKIQQAENYLVITAKTTLADFILE